MKTLSALLHWLLPAFFSILTNGILGQSKDSLTTARLGSRTLTSKPEIFNNGFLDILNNGQVNASARLIRLFIGEPGKLSLPLSFYSGVTANNFQHIQNPVSSKNNEPLVNGFLNPLSGLVNVSSETTLFFSKGKKLTNAALLLHFGGRILTGYRMGILGDPQAGKPVNFLNGFISQGAYIQTGAWEKNDSSTMGLFWSSIRYIWSFTKPKLIRDFLPLVETNGIYHGYCLGSGIEVSNLVNIKILYYRYIKEPEIEYTLPIYQVSFNYSLR